MTTGEEMRELLQALCGESERCGASDWFMRSEAGRLAGCCKYGPMDRADMVAFRRALNMCEQLTEGLERSLAWRELHVAATELWAVIDSEWRLGS